MADDAERLRRQIPASTDPERLERMARAAERRANKVLTAAAILFAGVPFAALVVVCVIVWGAT